LREHPVVSFAALTLVWSWGSLLVIISLSDWPGTPTQVDRLFPIALGTMLAGPLIAGLLLTGLVHGRTGFGALWRRVSNWRLAPLWYLLAVVAVPAVTFSMLMLMAQASSDFLPAVLTTDERTTVVLSGLGAGLMGGLLEEPGWTGFALPELRRKHGILGSGLILGFLWGAWHIPVTAWASGGADGAVSWTLLAPPLVFYVAVLPTFRVLMVWVHDHTESLLLVMLMHGSLTASTLFLFAPSAQGVRLASYYAALAVVLAGLAAWVLTRDASQDNGAEHS
jgi:hypothetical protein